MLYDVIFLIFIFSLVKGSDGLKDVRLDAPEYIREGDDATLTCQYDIETQSLYAVKWYHRGDEFYR